MHLVIQDGMVFLVNRENEVQLDQLAQMDQEENLDNLESEAKEVNFIGIFYLA